MSAFQSTRPVRGATEETTTEESKPEKFQSTRPVRGATREDDRVSRALIISIHAPRAGRDKGSEKEPKPHQTFQSTRPVRGATGSFRTLIRLISNFNPRAPCGARLGVVLV